MAAYRYTRLRAIEVNYRADAYNLSFWALKFYTEANQTGTEFASLGTAFATDYFSAGYEASKLIDNNDTTRWASNSAAPLKTFGIDSGAGNSYTLLSVSLQLYWDYNGLAAPKALIAEGSSNGTDYYFIGSQVLTIPSSTTDKAWIHLNIVPASAIVVYTQTIPAMTIY